ncbi:MAG: DUF4244 domain-containing protein [Actinobacteria bacterium]|nr:DUF4244 domain-containing protein [Actinomycetota bacterium]
METLVAKFGRRIRQDERGLSTAEYAIGTCAVTGLAGLLMKLLTGQDMVRLIWRIISHAFGRIFGF